MVGAAGEPPPEAGAKPGGGTKGTTTVCLRFRVRSLVAIIDVLSGVQAGMQCSGKKQFFSYKAGALVVDWAVVRQDSVAHCLDPTVFLWGQGVGCG